MGTTKFVGYHLGMLLILLLFSTAIVFGQTERKKEAIHEITIFVMPAVSPLNWENPATLFSSTENCLLKSVFMTNRYILGHLIIRINSPILRQPLYLGMLSANEKELIDLVFKQKVGFGILGVITKGRFETEKEIKQKLEAYTDRQKLAFMTYRINANALHRILSFYNQFTAKKNGKNAPSDLYGDTFWPRYQSEGSGSTALGVAILDVANVLPTEYEQWKMQVNIPMTIIGGKLNEHKKVNFSTLSDTKSWYKGKGKENVDYVNFQIYEPSVMYDWILKQRNVPKANRKAIVADGVPGLFFDCRNISVDADEPFFIERPKPNFFIEHSYFED
ncbi:MAG TPA: hypothetical protein VIK29_07930 [Paludibacter sp.]